MDISLWVIQMLLKPERSKDMAPCLGRTGEEVCQMSCLLGLLQSCKYVGLPHQMDRPQRHPLHASPPASECPGNGSKHCLQAYLRCSSGVPSVKLQSAWPGPMLATKPLCQLLQALLQDPRIP